MGRAEPELTVLEAREVPLGGTRAITVRRTLPHKDIRTIGPWCFVDHYGPERTQMDVPPHPHTGLQTVSWLLDGEVEHRDSLGSLATIRPGELNLMTSGRGIAHSEVSAETVLHGVQLWVALPDEQRGQAPHFEHHADLPHGDDGGVTTTLIIGSLGGETSPAATYSPIVGAHLVLAAGAGTTVPLDPEHEHAVLLLDGAVEVEGMPAHGLLSVGGGRRELAIAAQRRSQVLLIGGAPFEEDLLMWWNFVGRSHDEIVADRADWEAGTRFGPVVGYPGLALAAPALPTTRLHARPRRRG